MFLSPKMTCPKILSIQLWVSPKTHQLPTSPTTNGSPSDAPSMDGLQRPVQRWSCVRGDPPVTVARRSLASYRLVKKNIQPVDTVTCYSQFGWYGGTTVISWYGTVDMVCRYLRRVENTSNWWVVGLGISESSTVSSIFKPWEPLKCSESDRLVQSGIVFWKKWRKKTLACCCVSKNGGWW